MPRKIALLIHSLDGGGAERLMCQLAERWATSYDVHLVTWSARPTDRYPIPESVHRHALCLQGVSSNLLSAFVANIRRVRRLRSQLREIKPEFILSFSDQMNIVALEAARSLQIPIWIAEHSDPAKQRLSRVWELWRSRSYPTCSGAIVLTDAIAQTMQGWMPASKIQVIPPAIESAKPLTRAPQLAHGNGQNTFLFVGRLSFEKGVDLLLQAWQEVESLLPNWRLVLAGDGEQRTKLQAQAARLPRVTFLGWVSEPRALMAEADCFVLPSRYEGFPIALLEAMDCGRACIVTNCSSAIDELDSALSQDSAIADRTGALVKVPTDNASELARAMCRLATDEVCRAELGAVGRKIVERYHWSVIGPKWDALLMSVLRQ